MATEFANMTLIETFGRNVRQARKEKGWTQEQLAFEAGVKRAYLSEVENGQRNVSLDVVERLAIALEVGADMLIRPPEDEA
ncbi:MAG: helix-turn-helix domain-containing protein [Devosia sp.]